MMLEAVVLRSKCIYGHIGDGYHDLEKRVSSRFATVLVT